MADLSWWRIEIGKDGLVRSCKRVRVAKQNSLCVFYVQGDDASAVQEAALKAYRAYFAAGNRKRRERYVKEGRCSCGRDREDAEFKTCRRCRTMRPVYAERNSMRNRGIEPPKLDRQEAHAKRTEEKESTVRLRVLEEVYRAWSIAQNERQFAEWLRCEFAKLGVSGPLKAVSNG
jgi:hypothetical protein